MKKASLFLAFILTCNSAFPGEIRGQADAAIAKSHEAARRTARSFLVEDLGRLIQRISLAESAVQKNGESTLAQQMLSLNESLMNELDRVDSIQQVDPQFFRDLENAYRRLVRERLRISFEAQEVDMQKHLMIRSLQSAFESFEGLCKVGRSQEGAVVEPGLIPNIPPNEYSIKIVYASGGGDGNGLTSSFNFQSVGANSAVERRNTINGILGTSAGLSWSIAASGAAGASVAVAMTVAPWLAGAFAAYSAFNYVVSTQEEIDRQNEMARAKKDIFLKSANDRDIANYYQESCKETLTKLQPLAKLVYSYAESPIKRQEIVAQISASKLSRELYRTAVEDIERHRKLLGLASASQKKLCHEASAESQDASPCKLEGGRYVLTSDPSISISTDADKNKEILEEARNKLNQFNEQFPQEKVIELIAFDILDLIHNRWHEVSATLAGLSFQQTDRALAVLSNKLRFFASELGKVKTSQWADSNHLVGVNESLESEFFKLRAEYFELLDLAIKAFFNSYDSKAAKEQFKSFSVRFKLLADKTMINRDIQAMSLAVSRLKGFYDNL